MFSMPRWRNDSTSSIRMAPSSLRLARPMCSRSTAMIWGSLDQKAAARLRDRRSGDQHFVFRPMGGRAPILALAEDGHGLRIVLELVRQVVERGEIRVFGFENQVVELTRNRRPGGRLGQPPPSVRGVHLRDPSHGLAVLVQLSNA